VSGEDLRLAFETRLQSREPVQDTIAEVFAEAGPESVSAPVANGHKPAAAA
jgi:hypothetical protein